MTASSLRPSAFVSSFLPKKPCMTALSMQVNGNKISPATDDQGASGQAVVGPRRDRSLPHRLSFSGSEQLEVQAGRGSSTSRTISLLPCEPISRTSTSPTILSPQPPKQRTANGWDLTWRYSDLISGFQIGMTMPEKLQPGPLAGEISYAAPVSLFFFFFLMFIITTMRNIDLHPVNYFFLATAFFAFHLLLAYLVDHISIHAAMIIASVVSIALVVSYLRLVVGHTLCRLAGRDGAVHLPDCLFLCFFLEGIHWPRDHDHLRDHSFRGDAGHRENSLVREVRWAGCAETSQPAAPDARNVGTGRYREDGYFIASVIFFRAVTSSGRSSPTAT